jgi:hypothetical protein
MIRRLSLTLSLLLALIVPVLLLGARSARGGDDQHRGGAGRAEDRGTGGAVKLLKVIPATDCPVTCAKDKLVVFDISWVDPETHRFYLADRTNKAIDVIDTKNNVYLKQIQKGIFKGFAGDNNTAGPDGVVVSGHWLFVTDAPSKVWSIDLRTDAVVDFISTDAVSQKRTDELAYDPQDGIILAVNNADTPPFATLIKVNKQTGKFDSHTTRVSFGFATNGAEQPIWNPHTQRFYVSIPEVNGPGDGSGPNGGVAVITTSGHLDGVFPVDRCQPAGLSLGPDNNLLLGCSETFDTAGHHWSTADTVAANPKQVIMNAATGATTNVFGVGGSDEVWFNPGDGDYYAAARNNPGKPSPAAALGVIDAESGKLIQVVPTVFPPAGSAHSLAVDPNNNHVIVPLPANTLIPNCENGCFGVYGRPGAERDEGDEE